MNSITLKTLFSLLTVIFLWENAANAQNQRRKGRNRQDWTAEEYSGSRSTKNLRTSFASKGFSWLSGSPADNEKLSIGKNSQFFGFVALRYKSGRAANRGALGRAFFMMADSNQRDLLAKAVLDEEEILKEWWEKRKRVLTLLENHLYTGIPIDEKELSTVGTEYSKLGALVTIIEAKAFAALEDTLTRGQRSQLRAWRQSPESAEQTRRGNRVRMPGLNRNQVKQLENLFAKAFSWITGTAQDNEIIPLGQPAQFFGFVSIRHKSGHAASRGQIAKSFQAMLRPEQLALIDHAITDQKPVVQGFLARRREFLQQLALLRSRPRTFNQARAMEIGLLMGRAELEAGVIEAKAYRKIRTGLSDEQTSRMMALRGDYIIDQSQVESQTIEQRGAQLAILCAACHGGPGQPRSNRVGPPLDGIFGRPIASAAGFEYSQALSRVGGGSSWTPETMDQFLARPKAYAPGTKMEFQGLLNAEDRKALIQYLQRHY